MSIKRKPGYHRPYIYQVFLRKCIHNGLINVNTISLGENLEGEKENQKQIYLL